jgi:hypothetical protein
VEYVSGWPFTPGQCPRCCYLDSFEPPELDDSGYELVGFCRNPRIAMELFVSQRPPSEGLGTCPRFVAADSSGRRSAERTGVRPRG